MQLDNDDKMDVDSEKTLMNKDKMDIDEDLDHEKRSMGITKMDIDRMERFLNDDTMEVDEDKMDVDRKKRTVGKSKMTKDKDKMDIDVDAGTKVFSMDKELIAFRIKSRDKDNKLEAVNNHLTLKVMHSVTSAIQRWPLAFGSFLNGVRKHTKSILKDDAQVYFNDRYLDDLEKWIESTSIEDLKLYVAFQMVHSRIHWLGAPFYNIWFTFFGKMINDMSQPPTREKICEESLFANIPDLIGKYFHKKAVGKVKEEYALKMMQLIQDAMSKHMSLAKWVHPNDQKHVQAKLSDMIPLVGYTKFPRSHPSVLSRDDYPTNMYEIKSHTFDFELKRAGQTVNRREWDDFSITVDAHYSPEKNAVVFPSNMLQPPYFNGSNFHPARNFGSIGVIMGHELTHGFDNEHIELDEHGNKRPLSRETALGYVESTKCFIKQYSGLEVRGHHGGLLGKVQGEMTKNENIADNGGIALAWTAYRKYVDELPPTNYDVSARDADKMFFIAFGQTWCEKVIDEVLLHKLRGSPESQHSPAEARVNGVVMNSEAFATVFECKLDKPMNPVDKCKIW